MFGHKKRANRTKIDCIVHPSLGGANSYHCLRFIPLNIKLLHSRVHRNTQITVFVTLFYGFLLTMVSTLFSDVAALRDLNDFVITEKWRDVEQVLPGDTRILPIYAAWGHAQNEVSANTGCSSSARHGF